MAYSNTAYSNHGKYLETEILSADSVKLVCMLYRGAIEATVTARRHLKAREIRERSRQITRALEILRELSRSLDPHYEEISRPLRELYAYMQTRLIEANAQQIDAPLAETDLAAAPVALPEPHQAAESPAPVTPSASRTKNNR